MTYRRLDAAWQAGPALFSHSLLTKQEQTLFKDLRRQGIEI